MRYAMDTAGTLVEDVKRSLEEPMVSRCLATHRCILGKGLCRDRESLVKLVRYLRARTARDESRT